MAYYLNKMALQLDTMTY